VFSEEDRTSPSVIKKDIKRFLDIDMDITGIPDDIANFDNIFVKSLKRRNAILGCVMHSSDKVIDSSEVVSIGRFKSRVLAKASGTTNAVTKYILASESIVMPIALLGNAAQVAFFNSVPDDDGIVRKTPLVWGYGPDRVYPSLALEAVRLHTKAQKIIVEYDTEGIMNVKLRDLEIPVDNIGRITINFRKLRDENRDLISSSFKTVSACDILEGKAKPEDFKDKIVFVGTSAAGLRDLRATPLTQYFPGVEVHATIVDNILSGDMLSEPYVMILIQCLTIIIMGVFLSLFIDRGKAWLSFLLSVAMILFMVKASQIMMSKFNIVFVPVWTVLSILVIYPVLTMMKYWQEEIQKKRVRSMFGTMVSDQVLRYLEDNPDSFSLSGQKAEATIMFSDVAGFTAISENMEPERLSNLLNEYFSPMTKIIMDRGGYVDKYEGDLIMAEWGVPYPMQDHAVQACLAAIEQQEALKELREVLYKKYGCKIHARMGVNSGVVTAGNMGSDKKFQYTVMGDAVNLASRLEPANKDYETSIVISEATYRKAKDHIEARFLDRIVVQGKKEASGIYELLGKKGCLDESKKTVVALYEKAFKMHLERRWDDAARELEEAFKLDSGDGPCAKLRNRIEEYRKNPPPREWKGEYIKMGKD